VGRSKEGGALVTVAGGGPRASVWGPVIFSVSIPAKVVAGPGILVPLLATAHR